MGIRNLIAVAALLVFPALISAQDDINDSGWKITFDKNDKTLSYVRNGRQLVRGVYVAVHNQSEEQLLSKDYPNVKIEKIAVHDEFGQGTKFTYTYSGLKGKDNIEQNIYIYPNKGYLLVDAVLVAAGATTKTNYIAPIVTTTSTTFLPAGGQNYIYVMPHDNDNWISYAAQPWGNGRAVTSCEVSAAYDVTSRNGLVVGSIEHDNWKSGVTITPNLSNSMSAMTVAAGVVNTMTNDINIQFADRPSLYKHGSISGKRVSSPRFFLGYYADWRDGLEDLGDATAALMPKLPWSGGTIFAWQSWGGMAFGVNHAGVIDVSNYFKNTLMPNSFCNEKGTCYIVLDSGWSNLSEKQLKDFVAHCKANGQHPGIYFTPFSYWGNEEQARTQRPYEGCPYTFADMAITAGGKMRRIASIALDPTHPATLEYNSRQYAKFKEWGFEYVKLDFINNGTLEADKFYAPSVTTGVQAYNYGMDRIIKMLNGLFIDLSIAPVFPAKGHARRISCDCWGELDNSMYCLNSLEMGWWLDHVYQYNDPDHLVLSRAKTEGEARIRYTCGAMTGTVLLGDNYSTVGDSVANPKAERALATRIATNKDINSVAHLGRSFRPVEGGMKYASSRYGYDFSVDNEFVLDTDDAVYYAVFNYNMNNDLTRTADFRRIGINAASVKGIKELWTGLTVSPSASGFCISVPKCDVRMYRIEKRFPLRVVTCCNQTT